MRAGQIHAYLPTSLDIPEVLVGPHSRRSQICSDLYPRADDWEFAEWRRARVSLDYHIEVHDFGKLRHSASVEVFEGAAGDQFVFEQQAEPFGMIETTSRHSIEASASRPTSAATWAASMAPLTPHPTNCTPSVFMT